jgi:integrase
MSYAEKRDGDYTGRWVGQVRHPTSGPFRDFFQSKAEADAYEAYVKEEGAEPPWLQTGTRAKAKAGFGDVAQECCEAGGNNGKWHEGRDPSMKSRLTLVVAFFRGRQDADGRFSGGDPIDGIDSPAINRLVAYLRNRKIANGTINRYLDAASAVLTYAVERTPAYIAKKPKITKLTERGKKRKAVSVEQEKQIVQHLIDRGRMPEAVCILFLGFYGVRRSELEQIEPDQINPASGRLVLYKWQTKTDEDRTMFGPPSVARAMRSLIEEGRRPKGWKLLRHFQKAAERCGLGVDLTLHGLRHATATRMTDAGVPTRIVQEFLGHASIETTELYSHVSEGALAKAANTLALERGLEGLEGLPDIASALEKSSDVRGVEATDGIEPSYTVLQTAP